MEDYFLKPTWYLAVAFREGPAFFKITSREIMRYEPYPVGTLDAGEKSDWLDPTDQTTNTRILEPQENRFMYHVYLGISPEETEVYLQFPANISRFNLGWPRGYPSDVKWIDGLTSPFDKPGKASELITFKDLYPVFGVYNAGDRKVYPLMSFHVAKYTYRIVKDRNLIKALIDGRKPCRIWTFNNPYSAPNWLRQAVGESLFEDATAMWNDSERYITVG